jgi:hypothetical protein
MVSAEIDALPSDPPSVSDVREFRLTGPWETKSRGKLHVPIALPHLQAMAFLSYDQTELERIPVDIRGLRIFTVSDIPYGGIGGTQFHRIRTEISYVGKGKVRWKFEDLYGATREIPWVPDTVLSMPPFVLHTSICEEAGSNIVTLANTLYIPDDPRTHDTYRADEFYEMRNLFRTARGLCGTSYVERSTG